MISSKNKFFPEEDFERSDFSNLIEKIQETDELKFSAEAEEKLFKKIEKITPEKPFLLKIKCYFNKMPAFRKTAPAFAMLAVAIIVFSILPVKKVLISEDYFAQVKHDLQFTNKNQSFEDAPEETISIYEEDTNGDGSYDVIKYDLDSDGKLDYITIDFNHDNYTDILAVDTNGDGKMDYFEYDLDFDKNFDHAGVDTTGNEISDTFYIL